MNAEIRIRDIEILRLKTELAKLHDRYAELLDKGITGAEEARVKLKKAEAERASAEAAFESKCDLLTKREAELCKTCKLV